MDQQQLLLIILGVIVAGVAVSVGITMFEDNSDERSRESCITCACVHFVAQDLNLQSKVSVAWIEVVSATTID